MVAERATGFSLCCDQGLLSLTGRGDISPGLPMENESLGFHSCSQLPFVWDGSGGAEATGVKVEVSVGLHLIRGYEV